MFFEAVFRKRRVCGVDIGSSSRPVYVCAHSEGGKEVFETVPGLPADWDAAVALSPRAAVIRRIDSPFSSPGKTRRVLPSILDIQMPFSLEECSVAFTHMEAKPDGKMTALASAARIDDVRRTLAALAEVGVDPIYMDVEGIALWEESIRDKAAAGVGARIAVLKADEVSSTLVIGTGSRLISAHAVSSLDPSHVKRLLVSAYGGIGAIEWRLCGASAKNTECRALLDKLGAEWVKETVHHSEPASFLAMAVARRALDAGSDYVNLRQGSLQHADLTTLEESRIKGLAALLAACGILLGVLSFGASAVMDSRINALNQSYLQRANELSGGSLGPAQGIHALQTAERSVGKQLKDAEAILAPFKESPVSFLREIGSEAGRRGILIEVASMTSGTVTLDGTASSWKSPEDLELFLRGKGMTTSLSRDESLTDESVRFKISASGGVK